MSPLRNNDMLVDELCVALAAHFLDDIPAATDDDKMELARDFQRVAENACRYIEGKEV